MNKSQAKVNQEAIFLLIQEQNDQRLKKNLKKQALK